ncbi:hypothetical protein T05_6954 [Trichinella murrelli]|uniref:Uncharacterized protein n=1 Tax=Trichinella murrelli TaxID=144512 RepID=A0A0V0TM52_9BILA|nr:hypothetical protein T05_6954 [Trichinella murrelli]
MIEWQTCCAMLRYASIYDILNLYSTPACRPWGEVARFNQKNPAIELPIGSTAFADLEQHCLTMSNLSLKTGVFAVGNRPNDNACCSSLLLRQPSKVVNLTQQPSFTIHPHQQNTGIL